MSREFANVVFVQGFGRRDLFSGTPPESLLGWRRNVGLLIHLLNLRGCSWRDCYATRLDDLDIQADLFVLRDWRYSPEEVERFRHRYRGVPVGAMLFHAPMHYVCEQSRGETSYLTGTPCASEQPRDSERGFFLADWVVVRSKLNFELLAELGYPTRKMILMAHAPIWTAADRTPTVASLPIVQRSCSNVRRVLFFGESIVRKGLFRLHDAMQQTKARPSQLHVFSKTVWHMRQDAATASDLPSGLQARAAALLYDPNVIIHAPFDDLAGLVRAHAEADVAVIPSLIDNGPNALVEAYQLGLPIIATDLCGAAADLPAGSLRLLPAPRWWTSPEGEALTTSLASTLNDECRSLPAPPEERRTTMARTLAEIIAIWTRLLEMVDL